MKRYAFLHALALLLGVAAGVEFGQAIGLFVWFSLGLLIDKKMPGKRA